FISASQFIVSFHTCLQPRHRSPSRLRRCLKTEVNRLCHPAAKSSRAESFAVVMYGNQYSLVIAVVLYNVCIAVEYQRILLINYLALLGLLSEYSALVCSTTIYIIFVCSMHMSSLHRYYEFTFTHLHALIQLIF
ncbi:unnamed protein product, partial [Mycena citricolor]